VATHFVAAFSMKLDRFLYSRYVIIAEAIFTSQFLSDHIRAIIRVTLDRRPKRKSLFTSPSPATAGNSGPICRSSLLPHLTDGRSFVTFNTRNSRIAFLLVASYVHNFCGVIANWM